MSSGNGEGGECLCESCCSDAIDSYLANDSPVACLMEDVRRESITAIAALEHFPSRYAMELVDDDVFRALFAILGEEAARRNAVPKRLSYYALRAAASVVSNLPTSLEDAVDARVAFADSVCLLITKCAEADFRARDQTFATLICCILDALWPENTFRRIDVIGSDKWAVLSDDGKRIRNSLFTTHSGIFPKRFVYARLFATVSKPRVVCTVERRLLSGEAPCLHNRALSTLARLFLDEHLAKPVSDLSTAVGPVDEIVGPYPVIGPSRRIVLRQVPSALAIIMIVIREANVPEDALCHALYIMRELIHGEEGGEPAVRELLRLAPDAFRCFVDSLFRADEYSAPPLLDILFTMCTHGFAVPEDVERASRVAGFGDTAGLLLKEESGTPFVHKSACALIQAAAASTEACFVHSLLGACVAELGLSTAEMDPSRFQSPLAARVATEAGERLLVDGSVDEGGAGTLPSSITGISFGETGSDERSMGSEWGRKALKRWYQHGALSEKWRPHRCEHCGSTDKEKAQPYMYCKGCHRSHFCSARHQRAAWAHGHHKSLCEAFRRLTDEESLELTRTHRSGDEGPPLESDAAVQEYVQVLANRAAKAGVPAAAIVIVVDFPASMQNILARRRAEEMPNVKHGLGPGRIRITWETCFDWVGIHRSRVMSFEMDLDSFPTLKTREAAVQAEVRWSDRKRRSWWNSGEENRGDGNGDADGGDHNVEDPDETEEPMHNNHVLDSAFISHSTRRAFDSTSADYVASSKEYRVAWWEWAQSGRRKVRYSHCRISDDVEAPTMTLRTRPRATEEDVD